MKIPRLALAVPALLLVAACGSGTLMSSESDSKPASGDSLAPTSRDVEAPTDAGMSAGFDGAYAVPGSEASGATDDNSPKAIARAVISQGQVSLHTPDVDKARFELQKLLDGWDGTIATEESDADEDGRTARARLELRVPSTRFDAAMDAIADLGTLVDRSRTSEDVTTQVIDNAARVRSQRLSIARVQALLAKARDLTQVIAIEAQLSQRQADLDSLEQQRTYLADQTSLSTITVYLSVPDDDQEAEEDDDSFAAGLRTGWRHLGNATEAVLVTVGRVLPFAAVVALVGLPVYLVRRRRPVPVAPASAEL